MTGGPYPDGLVYEDIMGELMNIFKACFPASRGKNNLGQNPRDIERAKNELKQVMALIELLINLDKSLQRELIAYYKTMDIKPTKTPWIIGEGENIQ